MTINERFQAIIDSQFNGNKSAFAKAIGVSPTVVENVVGLRKGKPSYEVLNKICANANISEAWILSGVGEMLKTKCTAVTPLSNSKRSQTNVSYRKDNKIKVINKHLIDNSETSTETEMRPRIPIDAAAGALSIAMDGITNDQCELFPVIPSFPKYDFTIITRGDSMEPEFHSGDELACRFIHETKFIQWGRTHVLDTAQGVVLKRIFDDCDNIRCRSINDTYPDFAIPKNEIYHIAIVVGLIRHF